MLNNICGDNHLHAVSFKPRMASLRHFSARAIAPSSV
jgi:hypothetical protein